MSKTAKTWKKPVSYSHFFGPTSEEKKLPLGNVQVPKIKANANVSVNAPVATKDDSTDDDGFSTNCRPLKTAKSTQPLGKENFGAVSVSSPLPSSLSPQPPSKGKRRRGADLAEAESQKELVQDNNRPAKSSRTSRAVKSTKSASSVAGFDSDDDLVAEVSPPAKRTNKTAQSAVIPMEFPDDEKPLVSVGVGSDTDDVPSKVTKKSKARISPSVVESKSTLTKDQRTKISDANEVSSPARATTTSETSTLLEQFVSAAASEMQSSRATLEAESTSKIQKLERQLKLCEEQSKRDAVTIETLKSQCDRLKAAEEQGSLSAKKISEKLADVERRLKKSEAARTSADETLEQLSTQKDEKIAQMEEQVQELTAKLEAVSAKTMYYKNMARTLVENQKAHEHDNEEVGNLRLELVEAKEDATAAHAKLEHAEREQKKTRLALEKLHARCEAAEKQRDDMKTMIARASEEMEEDAKRSDAHTAAIEAVQQEMKKAEKRHAKELLVQAEALRGEADQAKVDYESQVQSLLEKYASEQEASNQLLELNQLLEEHVKDLESKLEKGTPARTFSPSKHKLQQTIEDLQRQLEDSKEALRTIKPSKNLKGECTDESNADMDASIWRISPSLGPLEHFLNIQPDAENKNRWTLECRNPRNNSELQFTLEILDDSIEYVPLDFKDNNSAGDPSNLPDYLCRPIYFKPLGLAPFLSKLIGFLYRK